MAPQRAEDIGPLLGSLKAGIEATVVGVLDGARGWLQVSSESSKSAFWRAFYDLDCLPSDWGDWDLVLLGSGYARVDCLCGAHRVEAFTVHSRWILVVLATGSLTIGADTIIQHAMEVLRQRLPASPVEDSPSTPTGGGASGGGGGQGPAESGIPAWWVRNRAPN